MESKTRKQSFKKNLAIATMAASLGVSLGVPVGDVLAGEVNTSSPPGASIQDKHNVSSEQLKYSNQTKMSNQDKIESVQGKFKSDQAKLESEQKKASSQNKVGFKAEPKAEPVKK